MASATVELQGWSTVCCNEAMIGLEALRECFKQNHARAEYHCIWMLPVRPQVCIIMQAAVSKPARIRRRPQFARGGVQPLVKPHQ